MLKSRVISPGIVTNEILAALGPYATLLFERLWMLADREGRLEDRPARIKAEAFPYWPELDVENLLENLSKTGFIIRYQSDSNVPLISICNFCTYQHVHPHEKRSVIPPPNGFLAKSVRDSKDATYKSDSDVRNVITCHDLSRNVRLPLPLLIGDSFVVASPPPVDNTNPVEENTATTTNQIQPKQPPAAARKPPRSEGAASVPRKQPSREEDAQRAQPDAADDIRLVRDSLRGLAAEIGMPPPDDGLVRQVIESARGASGPEIIEVLVALWKRRKFRSMYSWGFVPLIVGQCFERAAVS